MPCNYNLYPKNWKTVIRPAILQRANNCCETCKIKNGLFVLRGEYQGRDVYQDCNGDIFDAATSVRLTADYLGEVDRLGKNKMFKVVLTISHLDNDTNNNEYANLKALCQRCHLRLDINLHKENSRETREHKKGLQKLF